MNCVSHDIDYACTRTSFGLFVLFCLGYSSTAECLDNIL